MSDSAMSSTSMSKIFGESSVGRMLMMYSKRFAGSVTGFAGNYQFNPFFRTEVNIIGLQLTKLASLLIVIGVAATLLYRNVSIDVVTGAGSAFALHPSNEAIVMIAATAIITLAVVFSYVVTRMALAPVRGALDSQKQFIGNVAHELRTPISIIKINTEVALMSGDMNISLRETLLSTVEELDRTSEILNNLLSLSASIQSKRLEIEVRMSEQRMVLANPVALEQIVMNIVKNAIVHTPRGGHIFVTAKPVHPNQMEFTVQDSGAGIPAKDLFRIFEPYYRGDPSRKRSEGGSGLGLTIVSELVKLHGGKIVVRSVEGESTTVSVLLPAGKQAPHSNGVVKSQHENTSEIVVDFSHNRLKKA